MLDVDFGEAVKRIWHLIWILYNEYDSTWQ